MARNRDPLNDIQTDIPGHRISFDVEAFDEAIENQGVTLVHYRALRCPVGMTDLDDNRRTHPDHEGCSNGFIYTRVGTVRGLFINNSNRKRPDDLGFWDGSTVQVTMPRFYDDPDDQRIFVAPFDRFYLEEADHLVPSWQLFVHHESGLDRLKYPVAMVEELVDSAGLRYYEGQDFKISHGGLQWLTQRRPTPNLTTGPGGSGFDTDRGCICAIRYRYQPYWYVGQVLHEIRTTQVTDPVTGDRRVERMPQAVMLHREYVALSRDQNEPGEPGTGLDSDAMRTLMGPMNGGFGPK